jgi:hypothetical protein
LGPHSPSTVSSSRGRLARLIAQPEHGRRDPKHWLQDPESNQGLKSEACSGSLRLTPGEAIRDAAWQALNAPPHRDLSVIEEPPR